MLATFELMSFFQAGGGIGQEAAFSLAEAGAKAIVFADINMARAEEAVESTKKFATHPEYRGVVCKVDVTVPDQVQHMVDFTVKEFGRIDYAINGAGVCLQPNLFTEHVSLEENRES